MKIKKELDVDFIGGQKPLTKDEEKTLSGFFKERKSSRKQRKVKLTLRKRKKVTT